VGLQPASATAIRPAVADSASNFICVSLRMRAHYPAKRSRQGREYVAFSLGKAETKRPSTCVLGPSKPNGISKLSFVNSNQFEE